MLAPVNVQDVSGMHHAMARSFAEKAELDKVGPRVVTIHADVPYVPAVYLRLVVAVVQIHFMDPEDLLLKDQNDGVIAPPTLPRHFERNRRLLAALKEHGVSYR
jgi:hypothetical protein